MTGWAVGAGALGAALGSFLNVCVHRWPLDQSVVSPGSRCPGCGRPIAGYDNIPVLSFLILRGKARCCGAKMSPRYPLVELIGGLLSLAIWKVIVIGQLSADVSAARAFAIYGAYFALALGLVAAAFIDAEHMFLPDSVMFGGIILGVATATIRGMELTESIVGAVVGFAVIWLPFIFLYKGLLGRTGMGMGDAKLLALAGAWLGWPGALFVLFAGAVQGTLYAVVLKVLGIEMKLPQAVQDDIEELKRDAEAGDEEAREALDEDPLTEDEDDAFIIEFFRRLFRRLFRLPDPPPPPEPVPDERKEEEPRPRIPFGPFLIVSILEFVLAGDFVTRSFHLFGALQ